MLKPQWYLSFLLDNAVNGIEFEIKEMDHIKRNKDVFLNMFYPCKVRYKINAKLFFVDALIQA